MSDPSGFEGPDGPVNPTNSGESFDAIVSAQPEAVRDDNILSLAMQIRDDLTTLQEREQRPSLFRRIATRMLGHQPVLGDDYDIRVEMAGGSPSESSKPLLVEVDEEGIESSWVATRGADYAQDRRLEPTLILSEVHTDTDSGNIRVTKRFKLNSQIICDHLFEERGGIWEWAQRLLPHTGRYEEDIAVEMMNDASRQDMYKPDDANRQLLERILPAIRAELAGQVL